MNYKLMHKNIVVATLNIDDNGKISTVISVSNFEHLPPMTTIKGQCDKALLNKWWLERSIPASREGVLEALQTLDIMSPHILLTKCFGLSLSDQYWIKPEDSNLLWEEVNFFDNEFSEDLGNILMGKSSDSQNISLYSPDNTSDGCLKKRWKIIDGERCLLKAGSRPFEQQPFGEVIASVIMKKLGIDHVDYTLLYDDDVPYSVCKDFIGRDTELVTAYKIIGSKPKPNHKSLYQHYVDCCLELGIDDIVTKLDQMIVLDFLILNEDRHLNNFGLIRDANTLKYIGVAPIYDSGSCLNYNDSVYDIGSLTKAICKPFKTKHQEQLKLVSSFDWIDLNVLREIEQDIRGIFSMGLPKHNDENRVNAIIYAYNNRVNIIEEMINSHNFEDNISEDVTEDIAENYVF